MDIKKSEKYIISHRTEITSLLCRFLPTDTILFWSNTPDLFAYQQKCWQPILNSLNTVFKLDFKPTKSLEPIQDKSTERNFAKLLCNLSDKELTACFLAASEMKSVLLGFLLVKQKITLKEAFAATYLEELYQNKFWGEDVAAQNARQITLNSLQQIEEYLKTDEKML